MKNLKDNTALSRRINLVDDLRNKFPNGFSAMNLRDKVSEHSCSGCVSTVVANFELIKKNVPGANPVAVSLSNGLFLFITASSEHLAQRLLEMEREYGRIKAENLKKKESEPVSDKKKHLSLFWGLFKYSWG